MRAKERLQKQMAIRSATRASSDGHSSATCTFTRSQSVPYEKSRGKRCKHQTEWQATGAYRRQESLCPSGGCGKIKTTHKLWWSCRQVWALGGAKILVCCWWTDAALFNEEQPNDRGSATVLKMGGQILRAKRAENFFGPHFLASGGQNTALTLV